MAWIFVDKEEGGSMEKMRQQMRRNMRGGDYSPMMRHEEDKDRMYELGFRHGWEDAEDEHYRRQRDSRGRYL